MIATWALIRDTFREALARKIFWGLFGLSTVLILFFLFVLKIDLVEGAIATVSLFGNRPQQQDVGRLVMGVYGFIATFLYTWLMSLAVFASSGLIPSVLEPGRIELILSKPVSRTHILLGRFAGNILVVACNSLYLVTGIWLIFSVKTHLWMPSFLIAIPSSVFVFSVLLTVVVLIGVSFESSALASMVTIGFSILTAILAQNALAVKLLSSEWSRQLWMALYYAFPKVWDLGRMTLDFIRKGVVGSLMPIWSSALFGIVVLSYAIVIFNRRDF